MKCKARAQNAAMCLPYMSLDLLGNNLLIAESVSAGDDWNLQSFRFISYVLYVLQTRTNACHPCRRQSNKPVDRGNERNKLAHFIVYAFSAANSDLARIVSLQSYVNASFCTNYMRIQCSKKKTWREFLYLYCRIGSKEGFGLQNQRL